jgi:hypothetical protein
MAIFFIYFECLSIRLQALPSEKQRADALVKTVNGFFDRNAGFDCHEYERCLDAWLQLMRKYLTFQQSLNLIIRLFVGKVPRFFPTFLELSRTVKAILSSETGKASLPKFIEVAEAAIQVDGHKRAVRLLLDQGSAREALNLAIA